MYNKLVIIGGPTAVGKSAVGVELASLIGGEIISADSVQVYQGLDIGTGKITRQEMFASNGEFIPHHLLSILPPDKTFSVAEFKIKAQGLIAEISKRGKIPMLVGGTGLYIEGVIDPYKFIPLPVDDALRKRLRDRAEEKGGAHLHQKLSQVDPVYANKIHPNDLRRVIRGLEVFYQTGIPISRAGERSPGSSKSKYNLCYIGLEAERQFLYNRINKRVEQMIADGLIKEVEGLLAAGFSSELPALQSLGYRQIISYLRNQWDLPEAISMMKRQTRRYAKRQLTWFKKDSRIKWYDIQNYKCREDMVKEIALKISRSIVNNVE